MFEDVNIVNSRATLAELVADFIASNSFETDPTWVVRWTLNQFARNDYDTFDRPMRQAAIDPAPPLTGHGGWDGFFAGLADYLSERDQLEPPAWINDHTRRNTVPMFYPANNHRNHDAMADRLASDPAPWFTKRGVGLVLRSLPSGQGKHIPARLPTHGPNSTTPTIVRTQVSHEDQTNDVDFEMTTPAQAGIEITNEMRVRAKRLADESHASEE